MIKPKIGDVTISSDGRIGEVVAIRKDGAMKVVWLIRSKDFSMILPEGVNKVTTFKDNH